MREKRRAKHSIIKSILLWTFQILVVILFAYVLVYFFGQSRTNIGQSMDVTLSGGDTVLMDTLIYQVGSPKRGDVIAFKPNGSSTGRFEIVVFPFRYQEDTYYIKRIIGLPGETIQIKDGMIYIDGEVYLEKKSYPVITNPGMASDGITLGNQEYFVLGDNRNNSSDSRDPSVGILKRKDLLGRAWVRIYPFDKVGVIRHE